MTKKYILKELCRYNIGTFADIIYRNAILYPDKEAFVCGPERISFKGFNERVNRLINGLNAMGIRKGDVLGIVSWNRLEYPEVFGAAMKGGFILAHLNPRLKGDELMSLINDSGAKVLFLEPEFTGMINGIIKRLTGAKYFISFGNAEGKIESYREIVDSHSADEPEPSVGPDDNLVIFYTSGTTGTPRGAIYTHKKKMQNVQTKALDLGLEFGDRHLVVLPMFHIGGDSHIWPFFLMGGCNVIMPQKSFDPSSSLKTIKDEEITDVHIVPTQLVALINLPDIKGYDLGCLKRIWYAASPMPTEVLKKGLALFGPIFMQGYGQTESGPHTTFMNKASHCVFEGKPEDQKILASCGQPCIGVHIRIVDENDNDLLPGEIGEIIIRSEKIMVEYWGRPDETKEAVKDEWLKTGDMGYCDERGYIYIADRKKDMIITGGENVFPKEVEEVLYCHEAVSEAAVIGVPDKFWVERVHAVITLKKDAVANEDEIIAFCKERIASYKTPKSVEFVESLPKSPQGKILKRELVKKYK
jgi:acyl-CoA synthetase (AMP-forming)/AMP-acid ligase II